MWREAAGICVAQGVVSVALVRRKRDGAPPELVGWCVIPEREWLAAEGAKIGKTPIRRETSIAVSLGLREVFVRCGKLSGDQGWRGVESVAESCRSELRTVEPLCIDEIGRAHV